MTVAEALASLFDPFVRRLSNRVQEQMVAGLFGQDTSAQTQERYRQVADTYAKMNLAYAALSTKQIKEAYKKGANVAAEILGTSDQTGNIDSKMLGVFVREMSDDFYRATAGGQRLVGAFFRFSKQGILTENELTALVAQGWLGAGNSREGARGVAKALRKKLHTSKMTSLTNRELDALVELQLGKFRQRGVPEQFIESFRKMLQKDRFIRILDKNGRAMTFRVSTYSQFVARTRTADAQTSGTIEQASLYGVTEFQITSHNTTTPICMPHEGKIYTVDPLNTKFEYLTPENRPPYHINCKHRMFPRAFTKAQLAKMPSVRAPGLPEGAPADPAAPMPARRSVAQDSLDAAAHLPA